MHTIQHRLQICVNVILFNMIVLTLRFEGICKKKNALKIYVTYIIAWCAVWAFLKTFEAFKGGGQLGSRS